MIILNDVPTSTGVVSLDVMVRNKTMAVNVATRTKQKNTVNKNDEMIFVDDR